MAYREILLIDDDEDDQQIFLVALDKLQSAVHCNVETRAKTAFDKLVRKELRPDIIFLDLNMPVMNGRQFVNEIKKMPHLEKIPVVILSTSSYPETIALLKSIGAYEFITKPDNLDELSTILRFFISS